MNKHEAAVSLQTEMENRESDAHLYSFLNGVHNGVERAHRQGISQDILGSRVNSVLVNTDLTTKLDRDNIFNLVCRHSEQPFDLLTKNTIYNMALHSDSFLETVDTASRCSYQLVANACTGKPFFETYEELEDIREEMKVFIEDEGDIDHTIDIRGEMLPNGEKALEFHIKGASNEGYSYMQAVLREFGGYVNEYYRQNGSEPFMGLSWILHSLPKRALRTLNLNPEQVIHRKINDPQSFTSEESLGELGSYVTPDKVVHYAAVNMSQSPVTINHFLTTGRLPPIGLLYITPDSVLQKLSRPWQLK